MSTINQPSQFDLATSIHFTQVTNDRVSASPFGGSEQAIDLLNDRWLCSIELPMMYTKDASYIEAYIAAMRGRVNVSPIYHRSRPAPLGTIRGTLTLSASAAQGASSLVITGCIPNNGTFLTGDMLGVGGLLVMAATDCAAVAGVVTVPITNRIRTAQSSGASVAWNKPTSLFRLLSNSGVKYVESRCEPISLDFGEKI